VPTLFTLVCARRWSLGRVSRLVVVVVAAAAVVLVVVLVVVHHGPSCVSSLVAPSHWLTQSSEKSAPVMAATMSPVDCCKPTMVRCCCCLSID
jgi:hypothetical protein